MQNVLSIVMPFSARELTQIQLALDVLTQINRWEIAAYGLPKLYASGVRYRGDVCLAPHVPGACEPFMSAKMTFDERFGDCDDLAPWLAAERQLEGDVLAYAKAVRVGPDLIHCIVVNGDLSIEDPSRVLGM